MFVKYPPPDERRWPDAGVPALILFLAVMALTLWLAAVSMGQCPGGVCGVRSFAPSPYQYVTTYPYQAVPDTVTRWVRHDDGDYYLYRGSQQIAGYKVATGEFLPFLNGRQWPDKWPPDPPPGVAARALAPAAKKDGECKCGDNCHCGQNPCTCVLTATGAVCTQNFGIDLGEMERHKKLSYRVNGVEVSREAAVEALSLQDDTVGRLGYVVAVDADGAAQDWTSAATLAPFRESFAFQSYKSGDVMAKSLGYDQPGVYVVTKDAAKGPLPYKGADDLGGLLDRIKDPKAPLVQPKIDVGIPPWLWLAGAGVLGYLLAGKRGK